jgi:hypothetical protein
MGAFRPTLITASRLRLQELVEKINDATTAKTKQMLSLRISASYMCCWVNNSLVGGKVLHSDEPQL